jgi:hypothetical protein
MVESLLELVAAAGLNRPDELRPCHIQRRVNSDETPSYAEPYPHRPEGCLRIDSEVPEGWRNDWKQARENGW